MLVNKYKELKRELKKCKIKLLDIQPDPRDESTIWKIVISHGYDICTLSIINNELYCCEGKISLPTISLIDYVIKKEETRK